MDTKMIAANDEETVWKKITADLSTENPPLQYHVIVYHDDKKIMLDIDVDPGGGFESGFESTRFTAVLHHLNDFKFAFHHKSFLDEVGKFFGMEDVEIGYPEFDNNLIIKTNDAIKLKYIFIDAAVRNVLQSLNNFTFNTSRQLTHEEVADVLELEIDSAIFNTIELRKIYKVFINVLSSIDMPKP